MSFDGPSTEVGHEVSVPEDWTPPAQPQVLEVGLYASGICLTLAAAVAAVHASGFHLSQPAAKAHFNPLGVIVVVALTAVLLGLETKALSDGRATLLVVVAGVVAVSGALLLALGPTPSLSTPIGAALPWLLVSLLAALLGAGVLSFVLVVRRRQGIGPDALRKPVSTLRGVLAVGIAAVVVTGLGIGAQRLTTGYLDGVNEYHENPLVAAGPAVTSNLSGGMRWSWLSPTAPFISELITPYGIVVEQGRAVIQLDQATGRVRWRYERSDVSPSDDPEVYALDRGRELAVRWQTGFFILDAQTGARLARWPSTHSTDQTDGADPTFLEHRVSSDQTTMTAVDDRGRRQWQFAPPCHFTSGVRTTAMALVQVSDACGSGPSQLIGLDPASGRQRWAVDHGAVNFQALTDAVAVVTDDSAGPSTTLTGIDLATGRTRWTVPLRAAGRPCANTDFRSQGSSVAVICRVEPPAATPDTWVLRYDDTTGRLLDQADLEDTVVHTATMTADGRVVVAGDSIRSSTCPITVVEADGTRTSPRDVPVDSSCIEQVVAVGDQILVVNLASEEIRALQ